MTLPEENKIDIIDRLEALRPFVKYGTGWAVLLDDLIAEIKALRAEVVKKDD